jgi:Arc/MetJ-type ribon-helix-helix transcriptional regulator
MSAGNNGAQCGTRQPKKIKFAKKVLWGNIVAQGGTFMSNSKLTDELKFRATAEMVEQIDGLVQEAAPGYNRSDLIRTALVEYLQKHSSPRGHHLKPADSGNADSPQTRAAGQIAPTAARYSYPKPPRKTSRK